MLVECAQEERQILIDLVESRLREMPPAIRHSSTYKIHDELKHDREVLELLLDRLKEAQDIPAS